MGFVHKGTPEDLVHRLAKASGYTTFLETGTYLGYSARWARKTFQEVITLEYDPSLYQRVSPELKKLGITAHLGNSAEILKELAPRMTSSCIFWLDAHWSGEGTAGKNYECPLLKEIEAIRINNLQHIFLIDDARLFLAPPLPPCKPEAWPSIDEILTALPGANEKYKVIIVDDVIVATPLKFYPTVLEYCLKQGTQPWAHLCQSTVWNRISGLMKSFVTTKDAG